MEPRIQYTKTADGVSIAYWVLGEGGRPLLLTPPLGWSNIAREWQIPALRAWYERLASRRMLVRYDYRGNGMSDRDVDDLSLEAFVSDLEAVTRELTAEHFDVVAFAVPAMSAIAYVARHPERVSRLVLWDVSAQGQSAPLEAVKALAETDWQMATETYAHAALGWSRGQQAHQWAAFMRASISQADFLRFWRALPDWDVSPLLPQITARTLVLQQPEYPSDHTRVLTSKIPGAQLVRLGPGPSFAAHEHEEGMRLVEEFLSDEPARPPERPSPGLYTVLFTDIASSTALTQRLGDARAHELVRAHNTIVRDALQAHDGSEIKHTGDGIMASFATASRALDCAVAIQHGVAAHVEEHPDTPLGVHVGLNAGEPVAEDADLFGTAVQLARRICDQAQGGEILSSNVVRELAAGKGFLFADRGEVALRGFEDPVRLYEVRWREV